MHTPHEAQLADELCKGVQCFLARTMAIIGGVYHAAGSLPTRSHSACGKPTQITYMTTMLMSERPVNGVRVEKERDRETDSCKARLTSNLSRKETAP